MPYSPGNTFAEYPANVTPQFRSPKPSSAMPDLQEIPDDSLTSIIFSGTKIQTIKGFQNLVDLELKDVWQPVDEYISYEMILKPANGNSNVFETVSYGNLVDSTDTKVTFVCIIPQFQSSGLGLGDQSLNFRFTGENTWKSLSRIYMWSANGITDGITTIELQNNTDVNIYVKILASTHKYV